MWALTGPSVDATNERDPQAVRVVHRALGNVVNGFAVELPPHSLTALAVRLK
jgi:alpha-L-arabinofuranosidase